MALRVLLADESATIKKVMQISLQDFAVEVRSVQMGVDVLTVAQQFKPDIVFADILLQKKNGYDVCVELKKNAATKSIPVVLMWSGFMEIDKAKLKTAHADGELEKPFDAESLRQLVNKLVPKTKNQDLSQFLDFPDTPKGENTQSGSKLKSLPKDDKTELLQPNAGPRIPVPPPPPEKVAKQVDLVQGHDDGGWNMDSFEDLADYGSKEEKEDFKQVPLKGAKAKKESKNLAEIDLDSEDMDLGQLSQDADEEEWVQKDLSAFKVDLPEGDEEPIALEFDEDDELDSMVNTQTKPMIKMGARPAGRSKYAAEDDKTTVLSSPAARNQQPRQGSSKTPASKPSNSAVQALSRDEIEKIVRQQSQEIIEKVVQKLVPDIANQLIKDEIRRLLDDAE